jgi:hypothetical protein
MVQDKRSLEPQQLSLEKRRNMFVVIASCVVVGLKFLLVTPGKIVDEHRECVPKYEIADAILAEPGDAGVKGLHVARTVRSMGVRR